MTPRGRLRAALKLLDEVDRWNDRTHRLPNWIMERLDRASGLVAVTVRDVPPTKPRGPVQDQEQA